MYEVEIGSRNTDMNQSIKDSIGYAVPCMPDLWAVGGLQRLLNKKEKHELSF